MREFSPEVPVSWGEIKGFCSTITVGTSRRKNSFVTPAQEGHFDSGHSSPGLAMPWKFCGQKYTWDCHQLSAFFFFFFSFISFSFDKVQCIMGPLERMVGKRSREMESDTC